MEYNKQQFQKTNDKKVLHKIKKHWVVVSMALLMAIGGEAAATHVSAHADTTNNNNQTNNTNTLKERLNSNLTQASNNAQSANQTKKVAVNSNQASKAISNQANVLHQRILQNASVSANKQSANQNASQKSNANNNVLGQRIAQNAGVKNAANNASQKQLSTARLTGTQNGQETVPNNMPTVGDAAYHGDSDASDANFISEIRFNYVDQSDGYRTVTSDSVKGKSNAAFGSDGNADPSYHMRQWMNEIPSGYKLQSITYDGRTTPVSQLNSVIANNGVINAPTYNSYSVNAYPNQFPLSTPTDHNPTATINFNLAKVSDSKPSTIWVYYLDRNNGNIEVNRQQVTNPAGSAFTISDFMKNVPNNYVLYNSDVSSNNDYSDAKGTSLNDSEVIARRVNNGIPSDSLMNVPKVYPQGTTNVYIMVKSRIPDTFTDQITYEDPKDNHAIVGHKNFTDTFGATIPYTDNFDKFVPSGFTFTGNAQGNEMSLTGGHNNIVYVEPDKMSNIPANKIPKNPKDSNGSDAATITVQYKDKDTGKIIDQNTVLGTPDSSFNARNYSDPTLNIHTHNFLKSVSDGGSIPYGYDFYYDSSDSYIGNNINSSNSDHFKFGDKTHNNMNRPYTIEVTKDSNADTKSEKIAHATIDYEDWITHKIIQSDPISGLPNSNINYSDYTNYLPHNTQYYGPGPHDDLLEDGDHDVIYVKNFNQTDTKAPIQIEYIDVDNDDNDVTPNYINNIFSNGTTDGTSKSVKDSNGNYYLSDTGELGSDVDINNSMPSGYTLADADQPTNYQFSSDTQFIVVPVKGEQLQDGKDHGTISDGNGNTTPFVPSPGHHNYGQKSDENPNKYIPGLIKSMIDNENKKIVHDNATSSKNKNQWTPLLATPSDLANLNSKIDTANSGQAADDQMPHAQIPSDLKASDFQPIPGEGPFPFEYDGGDHSHTFHYQRKPENVQINYINEDDEGVNGGLVDSVDAAGDAGETLDPTAYQENVPMGYTYDNSHHYTDPKSSKGYSSAPYFVFNGNGDNPAINIYVHKDAQATIVYRDVDTNKEISTEPIQSVADETWGEFDDPNNFSASHNGEGMYEFLVPQGYKFANKENYWYVDTSTTPNKNVNKTINGYIPSGTKIDPNQDYTIYVKNEHLNPKPSKNPKDNPANYDTLHIYYVDGYRYSNLVYPGGTTRNPDYHNLANDTFESYDSRKYKTDVFQLDYFKNHVPYGTSFHTSDQNDIVSPNSGTTYGSDNGQNVIIPVFNNNGGSMNNDGKKAKISYVESSDAMDIDYEDISDADPNGDGHYNQSNYGNDFAPNGKDYQDHKIVDQIPIDGVQDGSQIPNRNYTNEIPSGYAYVVQGNWSNSVHPNLQNVIYIRKINSNASVKLMPINIRFIDQNGSDVTSDASAKTSDAPSGDGYNGGTYERGYRYMTPAGKHYGQSVGLKDLINGKYQLSSDQYQPSDYYFNSDQQNVTVMVKGLPYNINASNNYGRLAINREVFDGKASAAHLDSDDYQIHNPVMVYLNGATVGDTMTLDPSKYESGLNNVVPDSSDTSTEGNNNYANAPYTLKITSPDQFVIKDSTGKVIDTVNTGNQPGEPINNGSTNDKITFNYDKMNSQIQIEYRDASDPSIGKEDANGNNGIIDVENASGKAGVKSDLSQYATNVPDDYVYDYVDGDQNISGTYGQSKPVVINVLRKATGNITYINDSDGNVVSVRPIDGYQNMPLNFTSDGSNGGHKGFDYLTPYNYQFDSDASDSAPGLAGYGALDTKNGDNNVNDAILRNGDNDIVYVNNMQLGRPPKAGLNGVVTKTNGDPVTTPNGSDEYATYSHVPVYYVNAQALNRGLVKTSDILNSNDTVNENNDYIYKEVVTVANSNSDFNLSTWTGQVPAGTKLDQVDPATWTDPGQTKVTYGDLAGTNGKKGIIIEVNPTGSNDGTVIKPSIYGHNGSSSKTINPLTLRPAKATIQYLDVDHGDKLVGYRYHYGMTGDRMNFSNDEKLQPNGYSLAGLGQHDNILNNNDVDTIYVHDNNDTSNFGTVVVNYVDNSNGSYLHTNASGKVSDDTGSTGKASDISAAATNQIGSDFSISQYENNLPQALSDYEAVGIYGVPGSVSAPTYYKNGTQYVQVGVRPKQTANPYGNIKITYRDARNNNYVGSGTYSGLNTQTFNLASFEYSAPIGWKYNSVAGNNYPDTYPGNGKTDNVTIYVTPDGSIQDNNDTNNND